MDSDSSDDIWFVISRDFLDGKFSVNIIPFKEESEAWELIEEELETNTSQHWLLTPKEYKVLKELLSSSSY